MCEEVKVILYCPGQGERLDETIDETREGNKGSSPAPDGAELAIHMYGCTLYMLSQPGACLFCLFVFHVMYACGIRWRANWLAKCPCAACGEQVKLGQAALREKEELDAKWGEILLAAKSERADLDARSAALRGRGAVVRERMARLQDEVDRSHAQLFAATAGNGRCACGRGGRAFACAGVMLWVNRCGPCSRLPGRKIEALIGVKSQGVLPCRVEC